MTQGIPETPITWGSTNFKKLETAEKYLSPGLGKTFEKRPPTKNILLKMCNSICDFFQSINQMKEIKKARIKHYHTGEWYNNKSICKLLSQGIEEIDKQIKMDYLPKESTKKVSSNDLGNLENRLSELREICNKLKISKANKSDIKLVEDSLGKLDNSFNQLRNKVERASTMEQVKEAFEKEMFILQKMPNLEEMPKPEHTLRLQRKVRTAGAIHKEAEKPEEAEKPAHKEAEKPAELQRQEGPVMELGFPQKLFVESPVLEKIRDAAETMAFEGRKPLAPEVATREKAGEPAIAEKPAKRSVEVAKEIHRLTPEVLKAFETLNSVQSGRDYRDLFTAQEVLEMQNNLYKLLQKQNPINLLEQANHILKLLENKLLEAGRGYATKVGEEAVIVSEHHKKLKDAYNEAVEKCNLLFRLIEEFHEEVWVEENDLRAKQQFEALQTKVKDIEKQNTKIQGEIKDTTKEVMQACEDLDEALQKGEFQYLLQTPEVQTMRGHLKALRHCGEDPSKALQIADRLLESIKPILLREGYAKKTNNKVWVFGETALGKACNEALKKCTTLNNLIGSNTECNSRLENYKQLTEILSNPEKIHNANDIFQARGACVYSLIDQVNQIRVYIDLNETPTNKLTYLRDLAEKIETKKKEATTRGFISTGDASKIGDMLDLALLDVIRYEKKQHIVGSSLRLSLFQIKDNMQKVEENREFSIKFYENQILGLLQPITEKSFRTDDDLKNAERTWSQIKEVRETYRNAGYEPSEEVNKKIDSAQKHLMENRKMLEKQSLHKAKVKKEREVRTLEQPGQLYAFSKQMTEAPKSAEGIKREKAELENFQNLLSQAEETLGKLEQEFSDVDAYVKAIEDAHQDLKMLLEIQSEISLNKMTHHLPTAEKDRLDNISTRFVTYNEKLYLLKKQAKIEKELDEIKNKLPPEEIITRLQFPKDQKVLSKIFKKLRIIESLIKEKDIKAIQEAEIEKAEEDLKNLIKFVEYHFFKLAINRRHQKAGKIIEGHFKKIGVLLDQLVTEPFHVNAYKKGIKDAKKELRLADIQLKRERSRLDQIDFDISPQFQAYLDKADKIRIRINKLEKEIDKTIKKTTEMQARSRILADIRQHGEEVHTNIEIEQAIKQCFTNLDDLRPLIRKRINQLESQYRDEERKYLLDLEIALRNRTRYNYMNINLIKLLDHALSTYVYGKDELDPLYQQIRKIQEDVTAVMNNKKISASKR